MGPGGPPPNPDTNHDGKVTFDEFKAMNAGRMMERLDANKDGRISKAEFQVMVDRISQFGGPDAQARAAERWARDDKNKDGFLSRAEIEAASKRRFDMADSNHDGWLSKGELLTMRQNRRGGAGG
jgi:Ca2+-binding EF-hand superfamily protein